MLLLLLISLLASAHGEGYLKGGSRPSAFQQATVQDTLRGALSGSDIQEPYSFSFESGGSSGKTYRQETGDASGLVQGLYTVSDPRGHSRIVQYTADEHGFHADIQTDEPYQQSHNPANVRFVSTGRKGSTGSLYGGSQVKGGGGLKSSAPLYEIGQSRIPYGASGLDFYSYPDQRYTQSRKGTGISEISGPFGQQKVAPGDISQGKLHFNIDDSQQTSPAFISGTKGSYRTGQSQIPYGLSGFDYYSYPSQRQRRTKTPSLSTKASGFGAKGVAGRGVSPAFLGSTGISSSKGTGSGSGPFAQKQAQFKLGESDISYKIGQSQIPYGASGFDYYSYPAQRYRGPQVRSPTASKTSRLGAKGGIGGGVGPAFLGTTGVSSVKGAGSGSRPFAQVQERISPAIPSKTFRGVSPVTGGSAKGNYQFKLGESDISYKIGQSQIPYGASGFDYYSFPAQRYRGPQVRSPTVSKTSRLGAKGGTGGGVGPAFLGTTGVSSVKGAGSGSRPFAQVQERISPAIPSKTFRGVSPVTGGSAKGNYQFKLGESDISYKIGQSQIPYGASGFDYYSFPAQRYRGPQVRSPTVSKTSRLGAKGGTGGGVGPAFLGTTGVSSVKGAGSGSRPFAQVQERISPAIPSKTFRGVSPVTGGSAKGNYQFKLGESDVSYKTGQSQIPYGASGFDYYSYPAQRYRGPQVRSPTVSKTSRLGAKGGTGGGVGPAFLGSTGVPSVKGIGSGSGPFAQRQVQEKISPAVPSKTFRGVSQVTDGTAQQFKLGDSQVAYKIGQSQIPYGASGLDYYSYPAFRQTPAAGKTSRSVKGGIKGASIGGLKGGIGSSIGYSSGIGKGTVSTGAIKGGSQISQTAFGIGDIQRKSPAFVSGQYSIGQSQIPYGASGLDYYSYPEYRHRHTKSPGVKGGPSGSFLGASSGGVKGASQGGFPRTAGIKGAAQGSSPFGSSSGSIKGSTKGGFPGASLRSPSGGIKTGVGSQKRPYRIGQSSIPYGASGLDFSSYPTQRLTFSHGAPTFSTKTSPSLYPTAGGLSGVKSVAGSRIKGGYTSIPSRKSRDTSSLSKINRGSVTGQEKINIKLASEVSQGKIDSQVPISTKSIISSTKTPGGITRRTVVGDGSTGKTVVSQVKTYTGDIGGTKSSVSAIKTKPVRSSLDRKAGLYKVSQEKVGQEKVGQEKVVQFDIGGQSGGTIGVLNALSGQRQISSVTSSSTGSQFGVSGGQSDASFSLGGEQVGSTRGGSTGAGGVSVSSSTGEGASVGTLGRRGVSGASGSYSSEFSQGLRSGYSTYDSSENPARIEFSLGGGQGFSTYGTSSQSGGSSSGAVRGSGVSLGATRSGTSSGTSSGQVTSSQLSNIDRARSRAGVTGVGTAGGRRATTSNVGLRATGFQGSSLSGDSHGFSTYGVSGLGEAVSTGGVSGLGEAVSAGGGITAGTAGRRTGAALRSRGGTTSTAGGSFRSGVSEDFSLLTRTGGSRVSGISSTSGVRGAVSDLDNPAKIEFSLGSGQGFSTYGSSVGSGISSSRRTGDSGGISAVSGGAGIAGRVSGLSGIAGETGGISEHSGRTGAIRGSSGLSGTAGAFGGAGLRARSGATGVSGRAGTAGLSGTVGTRGVSGTSGAPTEVGSIRGTAGARGGGGVGGGAGTAFRSQTRSGGLGAQVSSGISETAGYTSYEGPSKVEFLLGGGQGVSSYGLSGTRSGIASVGGHTRSGGAGGVGADAAIRSPGTITSGQGVYSRRTSQRTSSSSASYGSGSGGAGGYISSEGPAQIEFFLGDGQGFSTYGASGQSGATSSRGAAGFGGAGVAGIGGAGAAGRSGAAGFGGAGAAGRRRAGVAGRSGAAGFGGAGVAGFGGAGAAGIGGAGVTGIGGAREAGFSGAGVAGRSRAAGRRGAAGFGGAGVAGIGGAEAAGIGGAGVTGRSGAASFGGAGVAGIGGGGAAGRSRAAGFGGAGVAGRSGAAGFGGAGVAGRSGAAGFGGAGAAGAAGIGGAGAAGIGGAGRSGAAGIGGAGRSGAAGIGGAGAAGRSRAGGRRGAAGIGGAGAAGFGGAGAAGIGGAGVAGRSGAAGIGGAGVAGRSGAAGLGGAGVAGRRGAGGFGGAGAAGIGGAGVAGRSGAAGLGGAGVAGRRGAGGFGGAGAAGIGGAGVAGRSGAAGLGGAGVAGRRGAAGIAGAGVAGRSGAAGFGGGVAGRSGGVGFGGGVAGRSGGAGFGGAGAAGIAGAGVAGRSGGAGFGGAGVAGRRGAGGFGGAGAVGIGGAGVAGISGSTGFGGAGVAGRSGSAGFGGAGVAGRSGAAGFGGAAGRRGAGAAGIGGAGVAGVSRAAGFGGAGAAGIGGAGVASRSGAASIGGTGAAGFGGAGVAGRSGAPGFGGAGVTGRSGAAGFGRAGVAGRSREAGFGGSGVAGRRGAGVVGTGGAGAAGISGAGVAGRSGAAGFGGAGAAGIGGAGAAGFGGAGVAGIGGAGAAGIGGERATLRSQVSSALGATTGYTLNEGPSKVEFLIGSGQGSSSSRASGHSGVTSAGRATVTGGGLGSRSAVADLRGTSVGSSRDYSGRVAQRTSTSRTTSTSSYTAGTVGSGLSSGHSAGGAGYISSDGREEIEFNLVGDEGFSSFGTSSQRGTVSSGREAGVSRTTVRSRGTIAGPSRFSSGGAVATRSSGASYQAGVSGTQVGTGVGGSSGYTSSDSPAKIEFQIGDDEGFSTYGTSGQIGTRSGGISGSTGVHSGGAAALRSVGASRPSQGGAAGFGAAGLPTTGITAGRTSAAGYSGYSAGTAGVSSDSGASSGTSDFGEITLSGRVSEAGDGVQRRSTGAGAFQSSGVLHALSRGRTSAARSSVTGSAAGVTGATRSSDLGGAGGYTSLDGPAKIEFRLGDSQGFSTYGTSGQAGGITSAGAARGGSAALRSRGTASSSGASRGAAGLTSSGVISGERVSSRRVSAVGSAARVTGSGLTSSGLISGERVSSRRASVTGSAAGVTGATRSSGLGGAGGYTSLDGPAKIEFRLGDGQGFSTYGTSGQAGGVVSSGGITSAGAARRGSAGFRSRGTASSSGAAAARGTVGLTSSGIGPAGLTSSGLGTAGLTSSGFGAAGLTSSGLGTAGLTSSGFGAAGLTSSGLGTAGLTSSGLTSSGGAVRGGNALLRSQGATTGTGGITSGRISTASRTSAAGLRTGVSGTRITSSTTGTVRDYSTDDNPAKILFNLGEGQGFTTFGASGAAGSRGSAAGGSLSGGSTGGSSRISGAGGIVRTSSEDSGISLGRGGVTPSRVSSVASIAGQRRGSSRQEELRRSQAAAISGEIDGIDRLDLGGYSSGGTSALSSGLSYTSPPKPGVGEVQQQQVVSSGGSSTVVTGEVSQQKLEQIFV